MGQTFLITLREGVEISLIVAILLAYLRGVGRASMFRAVWAGVGGAIVLCVVLALAFELLLGGFVGHAEQLTEGVVSLAAAGMLTYMLFWMRRHARGIKGELQFGLDGALERSALAVAAFAAVAVIREGIETVLLLIGAGDAQATPRELLVGGAAGLAVASYVGYLVYGGSRRVDLRRFFQVTAMLLVVFAGGMVAKSVHEFREYFEVGGVFATTAWDIATPAFSTGWIARFMAGLFGWSANPEWIRVAAYAAYVVPVTWFYFGMRVRLPAAATKDATVDAARVPA